MKLLSVSLAALAAATLATPALADDHGAQNEQAEEQYPMTPQGAADWVAMVEKDLFDYTAWSSQVYWVNATYITHDTDALAAQAGAEGALDLHSHRVVLVPHDAHQEHHHLVDRRLRLRCGRVDRQEALDRA